ncbi:MAG: hypothetical protein QOE70_1081 [Chthoniobacter sp.]|jgi:hypothetical protein|nr:hypothetical protein [Chthoniobacter sp.]
MNKLQSIVAGVIALAAISTASAQTVIYIAGANGDRATTNTAIPKLLGPGPLTFKGTNTDPTKANFAIWTGGSFGGQSVTIKAAYIGATGGIAAVAGSLPVKFLPDSATAGINNPDPTVGTNANDPKVPDIALSTNFVSSSPFIGNYQGHFYEDLTPQDQIVSVVGLKWVASKGFPGDNITPQLVRYLFANGSAPLALFTGKTSDQNKIVFATGRNLDAGQRFAAQAEGGIGINAVVKHFKPTISDAAPGVGGFVTGGTANAHVLWPVETFSGVSSQFPGNSGATTGANLAPLLTATLASGAYKSDGTANGGNAFPNATAGYYVSYLTPGDADSIAIPNGAVELKWNGVPYSDQAIREGKYTFWVYEHLFYRAATTGLQKTFGDSLANQIRTVDAAVSGIFLDTVKVSRQEEGGLVTPIYF